MFLIRSLSASSKKFSTISSNHIPLEIVIIYEKYVLFLFLTEEEDNLLQPSPTLNEVDEKKSLHADGNKTGIVNGNLF